MEGFEEVASLTDAELTQRLKSYGVNVGPIVQSTRALYEKKLTRMMTGKTNRPQYEEVPDDETEEEEEEEEDGEDVPVIIPQVRVLQNESRRRVPPNTPPRVSHHTEDTKTTDWVTAKPMPTKTVPTKTVPTKTVPTKETPPVKKFPTRMLIIFILVLAVIGYFVITCMEPDILNNVPRLIKS